MTISTLPAIDLATAFSARIADQDFLGLAAHFTPDVRFRALIPRRLIEASGQDQAIATITGWFGDASTIDVESSSAGVLEDRVQIAYRFHLIEDGVAKRVEQTAWCILDDSGRIQDISLVCSGFRPVQSGVSDR